MDRLNFFKEIGKDSSLLLKQLIEKSPIGSLILNKVQEIVYMNNKLLSYFDNDSDLAYEHVTNMFKCDSIDNENTLCVTHHDCTNCKFRNSLKDVYAENKVLGNLQIKDTWTMNNHVVKKWFDISLVPFVCEGKQYIWVTMIDMTDLMKFKVEADRLHILNDEDNAIEKNRFHENVMECISNNCQKDGQAFFVLTELKDIEIIQEKFGFLWKNEHLSSFYEYLLNSLGPKDYSCRYSNNQFLTFLPCVELEDAQNFIKQLDLYNDKHFNIKEALFHKIVKLYVDKESAKKLVDKDQLYIEYFKALSIIENFDGEGVCEITF